MRHGPGFPTGACALSLLLLAAGCHSLPHCDSASPSSQQPTRDPALVCQHVLQVNAEGFLYDLRAGHKTAIITNRVELTEYLKTTVLAAFQNSQKKKILVFVHGGLTDRETALARFWNDYDEVLNGESYPVFIVWPSGWSATYFEHLLWVRQGVKAQTPNEKAFSIMTSPLTLLADLGRAITRLPLVIANNSRSDVETVAPIRHREGGAAVQQYQQLVRDGYKVAIGDDYTLDSDRLMRGATYCATLPAKYLVASFIDGLGKTAWDDMLRRTQEVYPGRFNSRAVDRAENLQRRQARAEPTEKPAATRLFKTKRQQRRTESYAASGLPMFIDALRRAKAQDSALSVTLVGHSMGAIILNRVLRDAQMDFDNIVYLAAACSVADFSESALPYLREHRQTQFYSLSLHPVAEAGEWQARYADLPPRGSLLVWIDNFLTNPVTEQERTFGRWRNLFRTSPTGEPILRQFFDNDGRSHLEERMHFQAFSVGFGDKLELRPIEYQWNEQPLPKSPEGRCDNPLTHSEFSAMPYWKPSFWWQPGVAGGPAHQAAPAAAVKPD
jgi:hypothetical protein